VAGFRGSENLFTRAWEWFQRVRQFKEDSATSLLSCSFNALSASSIASAVPEDVPVPLLSETPDAGGPDNPFSTAPFKSSIVVSLSTAEGVGGFEEIPRFGETCDLVPVAG